MAFEAVNSSGSEEYFPQHPEVGNWFTLQGMMMEPHMTTPLEYTNVNTTRGEGMVESPEPWETNMRPYEPLTRGGGTMAK